MIDIVIFRLISAHLTSVPPPHTLLPYEHANAYHNRDGCDSDQPKKNIVIESNPNHNFLTHSYRDRY